jgi:SWI/SNF-related matrix-associated actin-dependent regulator of chromatin subfamily A-like protein 1
MSVEQAKAILETYKARVSHEPEYLLYVACMMMAEADKPGWNYKDRKFGLDLLKGQWDRWTSRQKHAAYKWLVWPYRRQLSEMGLDIALVPQFPDPGPREGNIFQQNAGVFPKSNQPITGAQARQIKTSEYKKNEHVEKWREQYRPFRTITLSDDGREVIVKYGNVGSGWQTITDAVRATSSATWIKEEMAWHIPLTAQTCTEINKLAQEQEFTATEDVQEAIIQMAAYGEFLKETSRAKEVNDGFDVPGLLKELREFQKVAAKFGVIVKRLILGDDVGLGKTIETLAILWYLQAFPALVVCQKNLKPNWERESIAWLPGIKVYRTINGSIDLQEMFAEEPDIVIVHYDMLLKNVNALNECPWQALVLDEAHRVKNKGSQRGQASVHIAYRIPYDPGDIGKKKKTSSKIDHDNLVKLESQAIPVRLMLTGTPVQNRPDEIINLLEITGRIHDIAPKGITQFKKLFCGTWDGYGYKGSNNLGKLHEYLRASCMIRRTKVEVGVRDLPPSRKPVVVEISNRAEYDRAVSDILKWIHEKAPEWALEDKKFVRGLDGMTPEEKVRAIKIYQHDKVTKAKRAQQLVMINKLKTLTSIGKVDAVIEWTGDFLDSDEKLVVFSHSIPCQHALIKHLERDYTKVARVLGNQKDSDENIQMFQRDAECRVLVGSAIAGGEGHTMTAASNEVIVDFGWTPAEHDQLEGRIDRMGQEKELVSIWYFVAENTLDEWLMELIEEKQKIVRNILDGRDPQEGEILSESIRKVSLRGGVWKELKRLAKKTFEDIDTEWANLEEPEEILEKIIQEGIPVLVEEE